MEELKRITGVIEDKYIKYMTNTGYRIDEVDYVYGEHIIDRGIIFDVDGDKIITDVLYVWLDNDYFKIDELDIED